MKPAILRYALWLAALVLLAWLYRQSIQVDVDLHVRTMGHFAQIREQDARINQYVLQARYGLLKNYDPLVATQQAIALDLDALTADKPDLFSAGNAPIQQQFARYRSLFAQKFELVESFKSHNAVLRNSLGYFPLAAKQELARWGGDSVRGVLLRDLLEDVLLYDQFAAESVRKRIEGTARALQAGESLGRTSLTGLLQHVDVIIGHRLEVEGFAREITASRTADQADKLFELYSADFAARDHSSESYKQALALLAICMLGYVAWVMTRLQSARNTLAHSLRELEFQKFALDQHSIVSIADRTGKILYTNDKFSEVSLYSREELLGQDHRILNSGHHPREFFKAMWATIGRGQVWQGEVKNRRKDGEFYWVESTIVPFMDEMGKPLRYVSIRSDITLRKTMDAQLEQQRAFYERITETLGEGLYVQDAQGRCIYMNSEAEKLLGWSRKDFLGRVVHDTIHTRTASGSPLPAAECPIMRAVQERGEVHLDDQVFVRKDGTAFPVALASKLATSEHGTLEAQVVAFQDISVRKQAELAILQAKDAAEQASKIKSDFLANMSHEIRTPMNGILGMTELALDTDLNQEQREYLKMVKSSADSLLLIINDILDFSKIESGKLHIEAIEFSMEQVLRETMRSLAVRAHQKNLELLLHVAGDVPDRVFGDPGRLRQVIVNLAGNAIKFTEHGEVEVDVRCTAGAQDGQTRLKIAVRDTGIGIPRDKFQTIFESFSQADTTTTRRYGGTGLGLTISAQLVELMGGHIALESELGIGSTFHFTLDFPVVSQDALARYQQTGAVASMPVLVVDDNQSSRRLLEEMLRNWNMRPTVVGSGELALEALQEAHARGAAYPLVVLDMQMPQMDGFALVQRVRESACVPPAFVVMLIADGQRGYPARCQELGIASYLLKPVAQSDLLDAIMNALGLPTGTAPMVTQSAAVQAAHKQLRLLLAEDNAVNQVLAMRLLERLGHQVVVANNGLEAVKHWQADHFDAILMDVDMPEMNGYEATARIRALEETAGGARHTPIVAMTAHAMQGAREECVRHGMDGYLSKPIDTQALGHELDAISGSGAPAPQAAPASNLCLAKLDQFRETLDNNHELFDEIVGLYLKDAPVQMQRVRDALAQSDSATLRRSAHALQGMVGVFGAEQALHAARAVEQCADQAAAAAAVQELEAALDELQAHLATYTW